MIINKIMRVNKSRSSYTKKEHNNPNSWKKLIDQINVDGGVENNVNQSPVDVNVEEDRA